MTGTIQFDEFCTAILLIGTPGYERDALKILAALTHLDGSDPEGIVSSEGFERFSQFIAAGPPSQSNACTDGPEVQPSKEKLAEMVSKLAAEVFINGETKLSFDALHTASEPHASEVRAILVGIMAMWLGIVVPTQGSRKLPSAESV